MNTDYTWENGVKNRLGAIFFIVSNEVFLNLSALELFMKERVLFIHENASGYYRVSTYFLSKLLCDILLLRLIPSIMFFINFVFYDSISTNDGEIFHLSISNLCNVSLLRICLFLCFSKCSNNRLDFVSNNSSNITSLFFLGVANLVTASFLCSDACLYWLSC